MFFSYVSSVWLSLLQKKNEKTKNKIICPSQNSKIYRWWSRKGPHWFINSNGKTWLGIDVGNATAALDELVLFGKASPMVEHYYLNFPWPAWWHILPHVKYVMYRQNASDFKYVNNHPYPLFKSGHIQKIMTIQGNDNNVHLTLSACRKCAKTENI